MLRVTSAATSNSAALVIRPGCPKPGQTRPEWWTLPENQAAGIGIKAVRGGLPADRIIDEFRALRRERGLPQVRG